MPDVTLDFNAVTYTLIPVESTDIDVASQSRR